MKLRSAHPKIRILRNQILNIRMTKIPTDDNKFVRPGFYSILRKNNVFAMIYRVINHETKASNNI